MKRFLNLWGWWLQHLAYLLVGTVVSVFALSAVMAHATSPTAPAPAWATPTSMAIKRVSSVASAQNEPNLLSNLDCSLMTYRLVASSTMQTGCFTPTAFGLVDSDTGIVIFNGTDEGLPITPYLPHQVLAPWPKALDLVSLSAVNTGGSAISLYKNPLSALQDQRNLLLQLTAKQLTAAPDLPLTDRARQQLIINPQSLAFSDSGSWMVAETMNGAFVRINLATLDMTAFAPAFGAQGSPALLKSQVSVSDDGHFVAIANDAADTFRVYDLTTCSGAGNNLQVENCASYDYRGFIRQQLNGLQTVRHLRFVNNRLLSFTTSDGIYELAPTATITSLIDYLGLGDSYTSGEGAFDYIADTDSGDNMCHLSVHSYPLLLTRDLFSIAGGHSVACSGALINDVGSTKDSYRGQVRNVASYAQLQANDPALLTSVLTNFAPGYIAQQRFVKQYQPAITTVSVGGDDIGFGQIVERCVIPHISPHISDSTCYSTYEDRLELTNLIDRTVPRWTALYQQLQAATPGGRIYAIGYPDIVADTGNCALNTHLGRSELEFAAESVSYLNDSIRQAAASAGVVYIDVSQALVGHRLCETASYNLAVNGLTAGKDIDILGIGVLGHESYHPNALGQSLIEQAILKQSHNLTAVLPATSGTPNKQALLQAPSSGRPVNTVIPANGMVSKVLNKGQSTTVSVDGAANGLKPDTPYQIHLDGSSGPTLGAIATDTTGTISGNSTIPESTTTGGHTIDVTGTNQSDDPIVITDPVYISDNSNDSDGDTIPDIKDSCPYAPNSGIDDDHDGVDDTCDDVIGAATPSNPTSAGSVTTTGSVGDVTSGATQPPHAPNQAGVGNPQVLGARTMANIINTRNAPTPVHPARQISPEAEPSLPIIHWVRWLLIPPSVWIVWQVLNSYSGKTVMNKLSTNARGFRLQ